MISGGSNSRGWETLALKVSKISQIDKLSSNKKNLARPEPLQEKLYGAAENMRPAAALVRETGDHVWVNDKKKKKDKLY